MAHFLKLQKRKYEAFLKQDPESGVLDVIFVFGEKRLYAEKYVLVRASKPFAAMFSDVWNNGEPIPITTYSYDVFYQLLCFLHIGECQLTYDNIFVLVDIAEFYDLPDFKDFCDEFLSKLQCTLESVFQLLNAATTYSLDELKKSILPFIKSNIRVLLNHGQFMQLSKDDCLGIVKIEQYDVGREEIFEKVYEWAEKQAMVKKESDSNLNLDETVKEILSDFMPLFNFAKMDLRFVTKYLVGKSLLPSGPELCALLLNSCDHYFKKVKVQSIDENGKMMRGQFFDLPVVYEGIQKLKNVTSRLIDKNFIYWSTSRDVRPSKKILSESDGIEWYLVSLPNSLAVIHQTGIDSTCHLIAELFAEDGFIMNDKCKIEASIV